MIPGNRLHLHSFLDGWLAFARLIGAVQMVVILTVVYWVFIPIMYVPFGLVSDPLRLRRPSESGWREREPLGDVMENMQRQW